MTDQAPARRSRRITLVALLLGVLNGLWLPAGAAWAGETLFEDYFDRADGPEVGNGWVSRPSTRTCAQGEKVASPIQNQTLFSDKPGDDGVYGPNPSLPGEAVQRPFVAGAAAPGGAPVALEDGTLMLRYQQGRASHTVHYEVDRKVTRLSFDFAPLYAMGGLDDRAWLAVHLLYLDQEERVLGEIRHAYHNAVYEELENSDTVYSGASKGPFDGSPRHVAVDASVIMAERLHGLVQERIAKTRILFELASTLCEATVEGYVDNVVAVLADRAGLLSFTRDEMLDIAREGVALFDKKHAAFPKNWVDAVYARHGQKRVREWLDRIPLEDRRDPGRLAALMQRLFGLEGRDAFVSAFAVSMLLHYI